MPEPAPSPFVDVEAHAGTDVDLDDIEGLPPTRHRYEAASLHAINAAIAAGRPLLVRGEPGTGKSQLARAAAQLLDRNFVWRVMDSQAKVSDLFFDFDAVERLAQAQVAGALCRDGTQTTKAVHELLDERRFIRPGPLWWAFDASGARGWVARFGHRAVSGEDQPAEVPEVDGRPYVVLIDEIDKTDSSVPNGLLEALGQGTFPVLRDREKVTLHREDAAAPLVVITTNDERELPGAFVRRCLVYQMRLGEGEALVRWLVARGHTHFPGLSEDVRRRAARMVLEDRQAAQEVGLLPPGQAEYLDLLRAVAAQRQTVEDQLALLGQVSEFALKKHPELLDDDGR